MFKKNILSSRGMSLVEILIALGIMGGISLFLARIMQNSQKTVVNVESSSDILTIQQGIQQLLTNPEQCKATFQGVDPKNAPNIVTAIKDKVEDQFKDAFIVNSPYGQGKVTILSYSLSDADAKVSIDDHRTTHLIIAFDKGDTFNRKISKRVTLKVDLDPDNKIKSCISLSHASDNIWSHAIGKMENIFYNGGAVGIGTIFPTEGYSLDVIGGVRFAPLDPAAGVVVEVKAEGICISGICKSAWPIVTYDCENLTASFRYTSSHAFTCPETKPVIKGIQISGAKPMDYYISIGSMTVTCCSAK